MAATELIVPDKAVLWFPNAFKFDAGVDNHTTYGTSQLDTAGLKKITCALNWGGSYPTGAYVWMLGMVEMGLSSFNVPASVTIGNFTSPGPDERVNADSSVYNGSLMAVWDVYPRYVQLIIHGGDLTLSGHSIGTWYGTP